MDNKDQDLVNLRNARSEAQKKVMEQIIEDKVCPFCVEHLSKYHKNPILKEGEYWLFTNNQWPYKNTKHHILAIYKKHVEHLKDLPPEVGAELFKIFGEFSTERNMPGGAVTIRFGSNPKLGNYGSTVNHIHAHLIEADLENEEKAAVKFKIGDPLDRTDK